MSDLKTQAIKLRQNGMTTRAIAKLLNISKSTAHVWTKEIIIIDDRIDKVRSLRKSGMSFNEISKSINVCAATVARWTKDILLTEEQLLIMNRNKNNKYQYNYNIFDIESAISYYLLGVVISDGCIGNNLRYIVINSIDKEWLESIARIFCKNKPVYMRKNNTGTVYWSLSITDKKITKWFIDHGCFPNKSLTVKMPIIPNEYFSHFVRGVFDGDGNISIIKMKGKTLKLNTYICSGSKEFALSIHNKLNLFNVKNKFYIRPGIVRSIMGGEAKLYNDSYIVSFQGSPAVNFCQFIYENNILCLNRKFLTYEEYTNWRKQYDYERHS